MSSIIKFYIGGGDFGQNRKQLGSVSGQNLHCNQGKTPPIVNKKKPRSRNKGSKHRKDGIIKKYLRLPSHQDCGTFLHRCHQE